MTDLSTKQRIVKASIKLFNENGLANVRLKQIAGDIGISVGNLAYHFKNKLAIMEAVNESVHQEAIDILSYYRLFPNLIDFDNQLTKHYEFVTKYPFYFMDLPEMERQYPELFNKIRVQNTKLINQIRKRFEFNQDRGIIKPEIRPGMYDNISVSIWTLITHWPSQHFIRDKDNCNSIKDFKEMVWNHIYPFLTEKGIQEFNVLIKPLIQASV